MKTPILLALAASLAPALAPAQTQPIPPRPAAALVERLDETYATIWAQTNEYIRNAVVSDARNQAEDDSDIASTWAAKLDMSRPPSFSLEFGPGGEERVRIRLPGSPDANGNEHYVFKMTAEEDYLGTDLNVRVEIRLEILIGPNGEIPTGAVTHVDATITNSWGNILNSLADLFGASLEENIEKKIKKGIGDALGFFNDMRWDRAAALDYTVQHSNVATIWTAEGSQSFDRLETISPIHDSAFDGATIVLVGDNFEAAEQADFHLLASRLASKMLTSDPVLHVSEPFASYSDSIQIHRLDLVADDHTDPSQRVVGSFFDPKTNTTKTGFVNLARLATVMDEVRPINPDLVVFVGNGNFVSGRATAPGHIMLLPARVGPDVSAPPIRFEERAESTFLHELGHSPLANLTEEYVDQSKLAKRYLGSEPEHANVTLDSLGAKWAFWALPGAPLALWDGPIGSHEGAYYHGLGVYRPSPECKMRTSHLTPGVAESAFCAVCREALARGLEQRMLFPPLANPVVEIRCDYGPAFLTPVETVTVLSGAQVGLKAVQGDGVELQLSVETCSLPRPLRARWYRGADGAPISEVLNPTIALLSGQSLRLELES
ncbi:MAG TPA: M64 family metallopeptidase, partial [Planctomycetota bacterium]|nr:M64 family metallopeptidase [Planctomycetota bacterium]